jgi:hypothetical protein
MIIRNDLDEMFSRITPLNNFNPDSVFKAFVFASRKIIHSTFHFEEIDSALL